MFSVVVYVPESHTEKVKEAMFKAGAGRLSNYDHCAWQTLGEGQFRALPGANPHVGKINEIEKVAEWKVEMICEEHLIHNVIEAMKAAHPYETAAYLVLKAHEISKS